jgi:tRNA threonylcarbamoyladenosine biosynthesis protein TsaB
MNPKLALLETSHSAGWVALGLGQRVLASRRLEEARRHARDLAPFLKELLAEQGWKARDLDGIVVSRGPGSYTGLRVALMSAKVLAYATGCALIAIDTFAAIAVQVPSSINNLHVLADAQQDKIYHQHFLREQDSWHPVSELKITPFAIWKETISSNDHVTGPGLERFATHLPAAQILSQELWFPQPESVLRLGLSRFVCGERDNPFTLEPLYLRPSSAEEKQYPDPSPKR